MTPGRKRRRQLAQMIRAMTHPHHRRPSTDPPDRLWLHRRWWKSYRPLGRDPHA